MSLGVLAGLAITWWFGWCLLRFCWPANTSCLSSAILRHCLSFGIGAGAASCVMFTWLLVRGRLDHSMPLLEVALAFALAVIVRRQKLIQRTAQSSRVPFSRRETAWAVLFGMALLAVLVSHIQMAIKSPHGGGFDSFATWNLRARFLFRGGVDWPLGFSQVIAWSHPDYPLLVSATVARLWCFAGWDTTFAPCLVASGFTLASVGLLVSGVACLRGREQGLLAGIALMATPFFVTHGASQFADIPLSFFILATMLLLTLHAEDQSTGARNGLLLCAGVTAGFAAWTKNEGLVFAIIVAAVLFIPLLRKGGLQETARQLAPFLYGLIPVMLCVVLFKVFIAPPNDLLAGQAPGSAWHRFTDFSRYWKVLCWFSERIFLFDNRGLVHIVPVLAAYFLIAGVKKGQSNHHAVKLGLCVFALMVGSFAMVYICTPNDLEWHLRTSLDRLILQLWPSALFFYFLNIRSPSEFAGESGTNPVPSPSIAHPTVATQ